MCALPDERAVIQHKDLIGILDGGRALRHQKYGDVRIDSCKSMYFVLSSFATLKQTGQLPSLLMLLLKSTIFVLAMLLFFFLSYMADEIILYFT